MTCRLPDFTRRPKHAGSIRARALISGERRYEASMGGKHIGTYETRAHAQRAIDHAHAQAQLAARTRTETRS